MGTPNDVANVAEYLGDLAAFVSGQHLLVTGGCSGIDKRADHY
jgi:hypothetical protein